MTMEDRILYRDAMIIVLNKPSGLPVHPGFGGGETLEDHLESLRFGLPRKPSLAHRLDRDTSGCLALGRNKEALKRLGVLFSQNRVEKTYWAVVQGSPLENEGVVDLPLRPVTPGRGWRMEPAPGVPDAQPARTLYRVLGRGDDIAWLELTPQTGRTHQLRVHSAAMDWPIVADRIYNPLPPPFPGYARLNLHAVRISLPVYHGKEPIVVSAPPPDHMLAALALCGYSAE